MSRESLFPFLPAVIAALTDVLTAATVIASQPGHPGRLIVFQVAMFGAALLAAVPNKWVRFVGFVLLLAGNVHHRRDSVSSDVLCCRVANGEGCANARSVRAGGAGEMKTVASVGLS